MTERLKGKVAIVTGAAGEEEGLIGIGGAIATLMAGEGAAVVLVNLAEELSLTLKDGIKAKGGECAIYEADVSDEKQVKQMAQFAVERYGKIDVLVNSVGITRPGTVESVTNEDWYNALGTNLTSTMFCCRHCIPVMKISGGGSIINISTAASIIGTKVVNRANTGFSAYSASKAAVNSLTLTVAADYAEYNIRSNGIIAGAVWTPRVAKHGASTREIRKKSVPLKTEGNAWDVAWAAVYLASEESRWVTGTFITVDGGFLSIREL